MVAADRAGADAPRCTTMYRPVSVLGDDDDLVDPRQQPRGLLPGRRDQQRHVLAAGGDRTDGGAGEQHVAVAVQPRDQSSHRAPSSTSTASCSVWAVTSHAATSCGCVLRLGTSTARAPAASAAWMSLPMSPTTATS